MLLLNIFLYVNKEEDENLEKFKNLCGDTEHNYKNLSSETFFKSLIFYCNLTMIICIKLQRKLIFKTDGYFISRNFNKEEIIEPNNLLAQITNEETNKFNRDLFLRYLCKILICFGISLFVYLIFDIIKYYRDKYYIFLSVLAYTLPINIMIIFLFLFAKILFISVNLEIYNDYE